MKKKTEIAGRTLEASPKKYVKATAKFGDVDFGALELEAFAFAKHHERGSSMKLEDLRRAALDLGRVESKFDLGRVESKKVEVPACDCGKPGIAVREALFLRNQVTCADCWRGQKPRGLVHPVVLPEYEAALAKLDLSLFLVPLRVGTTRGAVFARGTYQVDDFLWAEMLVPDRDHPDAPRLSVANPKALRTLPPPSEEREFLRAVRDVLLELVTHELDESLVYAGARVFDPHAPKPKDGDVSEDKREGGLPEEEKTTM